MSKIFRSKCFHITFCINFPYSDILIVFSTFSVLESYCSSWALDYGLTTVIESTLSARPNREQRTKRFTSCESWPSFCGFISTANASNAQLCASSKAKERPKMIKVYISYVFGIAYSPGSLYSLWCSNQTESVCSSCVNINNSLFYQVEIY